MFIATMLGEAAILKRADRTRTIDDLDNAVEFELSGTQNPADELVPVGYEKRDTVASLVMLVGNVALTFSTAAIVGKLDNAIFDRRITNFGGGRARLFKALVVWDFLYYWDHRLQHEVRFFWANHVTHHSSRRYNLSTALRQPWSGLTLAWVFLPMPLLGFSAKTTFRAGQLNLLYQYWVHTEVIDRLAPGVEKAMNTPSHHRVHHGANKQYLDKNYGGILIVWDKLFGTFEPELRRVKYGLTKNIATYNPLKIAYHEYVDIGRDVIKTHGVRNKFRHAFGRPGWQPTAR